MNVTLSKPAVGCFSISIFLSVILTVALSTPSARGDVIHLKNGNRIEGEVLAAGSEGGDSGRVTVVIAGAGRMMLRASEVERIEDGEAKPAEAAGGAAGEWVAVTLSRGASFYGPGAIYGTVSSESDDRTLVLAIPDVGKVRIPKDAVASTVKIEAPAEAEAPAEEPREFETTHVVYLKNGRRLTGNLMPGDEGAPVRLLVGNLGVVEVPRHSLERIVEEKGTTRLPEPPPPAEATPPEAPPGTAETPEAQERLREELRKEILNELLESLLEERLGTAGGRGRTLESAHRSALVEGLTGEEVLRIQELVKELGRQRNQNRVRAERQLEELGSPVLPFLGAAAHHPLDLTRRAVQRLVRGIGDVRGAPLAIEALEDADVMVRELAHEALETLLPEVRIAFDAEGAPRKRLEAVNAYWEHWAEVLFSETRESVLERLAGR
jgi:hypothetical protein